MQAQPGVSVAGPACRGPVSTRAFVLSGACSLNTLRTGHGARQCAWPLGQSIARRHLVAVCEKRVPASSWHSHPDSNPHYIPFQVSLFLMSTERWPPLPYLLLLQLLPLAASPSQAWQAQGIPSFWSAT